MRRSASVPAVRRSARPADAAPDGGLFGLLERMPVTLANALLPFLRLWTEVPPVDGADWHSFDTTPWRHPWLVPENLERMRDFSRRQREQLLERAARLDADGLSFACVGNTANYLYERAIPLRRLGMDVEVVLHPQDNYVMSDPGWEHFDGSLPRALVDVRDLEAAGIELPRVEGVVRPPNEEEGHGVPFGRFALEDFVRRYPRLRATDFLRWPGYFTLLPALSRIARADALMATQAVYLSYLSGRPYLATQMGGDLWFECSRGDALGMLQRRAYAASDAILASNPWTFSHARRYRLRNAIYLPYYLDEQRYSPGHGKAREQWEREVGGDFFVLCTARLDDRYKDSGEALAGVRRFMARHPGARLVLINWGEDAAAHQNALADVAAAGRVLSLPMSGKRLLVDYLRSADCLVDQMVVGYFGSSGLEGMACGLPVIMRLELEQYDALCETGAPPVLQAPDADAVCNHLERLAKDRAARQEAGEALRSWFLDNASGRRWAEEYRLLMIACAHRVRPDFAASPLDTPLTAAEVEYHAEQRLAAPTFPSYH